MSRHYLAATMMITALVVFQPVLLRAQQIKTSPSTTCQENLPPDALPGDKAANYRACYAVRKQIIPGKDVPLNQMLRKAAEIEQSFAEGFHPGNGLPANDEPACEWATFAQRDYQATYMEDFAALEGGLEQEARAVGENAKSEAFHDLQTDLKKACHKKHHFLFF